LPLSNGAAEVAGAPVAVGLAPAVGGVPAGLPFPRPLSNGAVGAVGELMPAGDAGGVPMAPGRPGRFPLSGPATGAVGAGEVMPAGGTVGEIPPGARPAAAAPVGGGMFFGFSVWIFCFNCAALATPVQPFSIFGCATLVFTRGGAIAWTGLLILFGAATTSLSPWTLVIPPDLAAADRSTFACRSSLRR